MPSLYEISIPILKKALQTEVHLLKKGEQWAQENGVPRSELTSWRIHEAMLPLWAQVEIPVMHAQMAISRLTGGAFPSVDIKEMGLDDLYVLVDRAIEALDRVDSAEKITVDESTVFSCMLGAGECKLTLTDSVYLYTLPNICFHVTTLYDILRMKGVQLGKLDYINLFISDVRRD